MKSNWSLWQIITNNALEISVDTPWDYIVSLDGLLKMSVNTAKIFGSLLQISLPPEYSDFDFFPLTH